ncbi:DUF5666 domain-containing protein [Lichenicoccus sp.]|uniref:DUF5666 domain-containing protein n=1 Tax=Lichenicoccus sp. TaxID=2781899 RepID=UPI003D10DD3E
MRKFLLIAGLGAVALAAQVTATQAARADAGPPPRTRGVITAMSDTTVTLKTRFAGPVTLKITPETGYVGATKASLADAKQGRFIGVAANPGPGGTLRAREVTIFPESMRGAGEGHYGWDLGPEGSMTNGTIGTVTGSSGRTMTVDYKGGKKTMTVPQDAPVVDLEAGDKSLLKAGAHVVAFGPKNPDGSVDAKRIVVGEDGAVPPM